MGLLDGLLQQVMQSTSGAGGQSALVNTVLAMLTNNAVAGAPAAPVGGMSGGLAGLVQAMEQNGLGHVAQSWIGTGANQPVSPDQLKQVIGAPQLQHLAAQHGLDVDQLASHLAQILPAAVNHMTPNGSLPAGLDSILGGGLGNTLKGLMGGTNN